MWLFLILALVPIIEIALFIQVGGFVGLWPTLAIVVITAITGSLLLRTQGLTTVQNLQSSLAEGRNPMDPIANGALILVAGILLMTPGFFTDALGLLLLIPPVRYLAIKLAAEKFKASANVYTSGFDPRPASESVVEAEYEVVDETSPPRDNSNWRRDE